MERKPYLNGNGRPPVNNEHQAILASWQERVFGPNPDLYGRLRKFEEETREVLEIPPTMGTIAELNNPSPEDSKKLAGEVVDTIIAGLGVLTVLGENFEQLFYDKLGVMYKKYDPEKVNGHVENGHSRESAVQLVRNEWSSLQAPPYEHLGVTGYEQE